jgi:1-acyl-sn-glycerol-3-phosphate acyltransferase
MPDASIVVRAAGAEARVSRATSLYRLSFLVAHIAYGCFYVGVLFPFLSYRRRLRAIKRWSRRLLAILHVHHRVSGVLPRGHQPTMIVCNHVSWLDIWVIDAVLPLRFVAKADVRRWPVIGFLVSRAGTIFVEREKRHDTARTNRAIVQALTRGEYIGVFPEGTTTDGTEVKQYHASLFQPALGAGARVVVSAIQYRSPDGSLDMDAHYEGERSLVESLRLILARKRLDVELIFARAIDVHGKTRRRIAQEAEAITADALGLARPSRRPGRAGDLPTESPKAASPTHNPYPAQ